MKRFYEKVGVEQKSGPAGLGWQVTLDGRGIKTVKGTPQIVPSEPFARALAQEWAMQGDELDPKAFTMRDTADYAIDIIAPDPAGVADKLVHYGDTDTLLYRAAPEDALYARQQEVWEPIVTRFESREGVTFTRVSGIMHRPQNEAALSHLRERLTAQNPFVLAAVEAMTNLAASLIIGLSASEAADQEEAASLWRAVCLEEAWQAELWGRDEEEEIRREKRREDFLSAHAVTRLAGG